MKAAPSHFYLHACIGLFVAFSLNQAVLAEEQKGPVADAYREIQAQLPEANDLLAEGKWTAAVNKLTSVHPEATRTIDQSQALASFLFHLHPEESYRLHKAVAAARAGQELPNYMWAVEQHRRGEWKGALESYKTASKLMGDYALSYGLAAECAIRLGQVDEAAKLWDKSENAQTGTLEDFETDVCRIHGPQPKHREREELMSKVTSGDLDAAVRLIALDLEWPEDWWNSGPNKRFLKADLSALEKLKNQGGREMELALLAAKIASEEPKADEAKKLVGKAMLLESQPSLPANGRVLSFLLTFIHDIELAPKDTLRERWGPVIKIAAKQSTDAELHNALAWLYMDQAELTEIDLQGWEKTHDARFAASYFGGAMSRNELKLDSPLFVKALAEYPDHYVIQSIPLGLTERLSPRYREALIATIKADYVLLPRAGMIPRCSAKPLGMLFKELTEISKP